MVRQKHNLFSAQELVTVCLFCLCHAHIHRKSAWSKGSQNRPNNPSSIPSVFLALFGCIPVCLCYTVIYNNTQGFTDPIIFFSPVMSSGCLETPCDKSVTSPFKIQTANGLRYVFVYLSIHQFIYFVIYSFISLYLTSEPARLASSSAAISHPQS